MKHGGLGGSVGAMEFHGFVLVSRRRWGAVGGVMVRWGFMDWAAAERVLGCVEVGGRKTEGRGCVGHAAGGLSWCWPCWQALVSGIR